MTDVDSRTVFASVAPRFSALNPHVSERGKTRVEENHELDLPLLGTASRHARIFAWLERDARTLAHHEARRIFEIKTPDGRSVVSVEADR